MAGHTGATCRTSASASSPSAVLADHLHARVCLDQPRDTITIDIRGSLTGTSREDLSGIIGRIRRLRAGTKIRVLLGNAEAVDPAALAELPTGPDVTATYLRRSAGGANQTHPPADALSNAALAGTTAGSRLRTLGLARFTDDDLLSASDFIFAWLDDENRCPGTDVPDMIAQYELIGEEISARNPISLPADKPDSPWHQRPSAAAGIRAQGEDLPATTTHACPGVREGVNRRC